jgi:predicted ribosomally synthesized peptide with SipW-like signal peptide
MVRTQKKKGVTLVLAIILVVALAVTGTLMLFTAQSETATNVFTVGSIKALLQEYDGTDNATYQTIGKTYEEGKQSLEYGDYNTNGVFKGIKVDNAMPGDTYTKRPRVKNGGPNPFYTAVYGTVTFEKEGKKLGWGEITALINETLENAGEVPEQDGMDAEKYQAAKNYAFLDLVLTDESEVNDAWYGAPVTAKDVTVTVGEDESVSTEFYGVWYYTENNKLKALEPNTATEDIFKTVFIPEKLSNLAQGVSISLEMQALAVQSDHVKDKEITAGSGPDKTAVWEGFFQGAVKAAETAEAVEVE